MAGKKAGLPVAVNKSQPLPLMRQVQIAAGGLILIGVILGYTVNSGFFLLSGFVGAGLLFAGISGFLWDGKVVRLRCLGTNELEKRRRTRHSGGIRPQ